MIFFPSSLDLFPSIHFTSSTKIPIIFPIRIKICLRHAVSLRTTINRQWNESEYIIIYCLTTLLQTQIDYVRETSSQKPKLKNVENDTVGFLTSSSSLWFLTHNSTVIHHAIRTVEQSFYDTHFITSALGILICSFNMIRQHLVYHIGMVRCQHVAVFVCEYVFQKYTYVAVDVIRLQLPNGSIFFFTTIYSYKTVYSERPCNHPIVGNTTLCVWVCLWLCLWDKRKTLHITTPHFSFWFVYIKTDSFVYGYLQFRSGKKIK